MIRVQARAAPTTSNPINIKHTFNSFHRNIGDLVRLAIRPQKSSRNEHQHNGRAQMELKPALGFGVGSHDIDFTLPTAAR
jgi:hypothetical protein